jgi:hypothetical protein
MSDLSTAREALIAEAIGEAGRLLVRLEGVAPALEKTQAVLLRASEQLACEARALEAGTVRATEHTKAVALRHIAERTESLAREAVAPALRQLLREELKQALQREGWSALPGWVTHLAAAAAGCALTLTVLAWWRP